MSHYLNCIVPPSEPMLWVLGIEYQFFYQRDIKLMKKNLLVLMISLNIDNAWVDS